jgi:hypothetical protein
VSQIERIVFMMHHRFFRVLFCLALCGLLTPAQMLCAQTFGEQILLSPDKRRVVEQKLGAQIDWGNEAVRVLTSKRAEVSLNGAWNFAPAASNVAPRNNEWGFARVPGSWRRNTDVLLQGEGARWQGVNFSELSAGWYQRQVRIPADWDGRTIELDFAAFRPMPRFTSTAEKPAKLAGLKAKSISPDS